MKIKQSVPKRQHIKFRSQGIALKKVYNVHSLVCEFKARAVFASNVLQILRE
jgi:hypothetical protein